MIVLNQSSTQPVESTTSARVNWRELYAGGLVLLIGIVFLIAEIVSKLSSRASSYSAQNDVISINRDELYSDIRGLLTVTLGVLGGILFFRKRRIGWIMSFSLLVICAVIAGGSLQNGFCASHPVHRSAGGVFFFSINDRRNI